MTARRRQRRFLLLLSVLAAAVGGCAEPERLAARDREAPPGVDFSGNWVYEGDFDAYRREVNRAIALTDGVDERRVLRTLRAPPPGTAPRQRPEGGIAHVFVEHADQLKLTQTPHALFVSFGRSVVEEYRYGELRIARVGEAAAQRSSGWDGEEFVVETLDESGMKVTERYRLADAGRTLQRELVFRDKDLRKITVVQDFRRRP